MMETLQILSNFLRFEESKMELSKREKDNLAKKTFLKIAKYMRLTFERSGN